MKESRLREIDFLPMSTSPRRAVSSRSTEADVTEWEDTSEGPRSTAEWDKHKRPPAHICPQKYCFLWISARGPIGNLPAVPEGHCGFEYRLCTRLDPVNGDADYYEPCEPELEADDLPWFYFMTPAEMLASPFRKKYLRLTRDLWGEDLAAAASAEPDAAEIEGERTK